MVLSKLTEYFTSSASHFKPPGLPPNPGSLQGYTFSSPKKNTNLRLSSSLQDLPSYHQLDPEGLDPGTERSSGNALPPNFLKQVNGAPSFSKEKVSVSSPRRKKWGRVIFILFLLLFACLCFGLLFLFTNWSRGASKFYVVLDCGSTGTRVYVYQASMNHKNDNNRPILLKSLPQSFKGKSGSQPGRAYNRMETEPGFDKLVHNISGLKKAIKPLIRWAEKQIPEKSHKMTSLFLYATAGVRRLPSSDSDWLLNNAWSILQSSSFLCKKEWIKTITGMEEAYYGWIALNYRTGVLGSIPKKETYGALDLGGSSLQVTFEDKQSSHEQTSLKLSIGPANHHVSAYSLAGYGLNDAFDKSVTHLLKRLPQTSSADLVNGKVEIKHPCLQSGYKERYRCSRCASTQLKDGNPPIGRERLGIGGKSGISVQLVGALKWEECSALAKAVINLSKWSNHSRGLDCELQPCALAETLPRPTGQFYAISGFYVVYRFFNLTSDDSLDDVLEKGREFCERTWDAARASVLPQPFIEQYCFRAPYVVHLLRDGLHIADRQVTVGSGSITWTLGVALFEAGQAFPYRGRFYIYQALRVKIHPFVLFAMLFASFFLLLCAFSYVGHSWVPKFSRRSFLPLFKHNSAASTSMLNIPTPFRFRRWSPINSGDAKVKMPLSPTVANTQQRAFDARFGFGDGGIQFTESSLYSSSSSVAHSYSSGSLGHMQFDHNTVGSSWAPNRSQMRLQSRRSQSREDLYNSTAEGQLTKL